MPCPSKAREMLHAGGFMMSSRLWCWRCTVCGKHCWRASKSAESCSMSCKFETSLSPRSLLAARRLVLQNTGMLLPLHYNATVGRSFRCQLLKRRKELVHQRNDSRHNQVLPVPARSRAAFFKAYTGCGPYHAVFSSYVEETTSFRRCTPVEVTIAAW